MKKYLLLNDYSEGAHPEILKALSASNLKQEIGYGEDTYCVSAKNEIRKLIQNEDADVHFVSGGTQANLTILSSLLKPYESVISANTGHINIHEAGAIEATGHKIEEVFVPDGKLAPDLIKGLIEEHKDEHMTLPRVVFISNSTEVGTIYRKAELENLSQFCRGNSLYLYLDGARIGSALTAKSNDLSLPDIARLTDVFYIGGTKNGALLGEAIVVCNKKLQPDFRRCMKQKGALLAKGRILGVQFEELFKDNLFFKIAEHANIMAGKLSDEIRKLGYGFMTESATNQIFPIFPNDIIKNLEAMYGFYIWSKVNDDKSAIRLVTSWATEEKAVNEFINDLRRISQHDDKTSLSG